MLGSGEEVGVGFSGSVSGVAGNATDVYAVGSFDTAGSTFSVNVARWQIGDRIFANGFGG